MTRILKRLAKTDQRIRDTNQLVDECRARIARRAKNPALAEQAAKELPVLLRHLKELAIYRNCLIAAQEFEFDPPKRPPQLPRYIR